VPFSFLLSAIKFPDIDIVEDLSALPAILFPYFQTEIEKVTLSPAQISVFSEQSNSQMKNGSVTY
jgi:hypothetical protein